MTKPHHYCHLVSLTLLLSLAVGPAVADTLIIDSKSSPARYQEAGGSWNSGGQGMNGDYRWFSGEAAKAQVTYTPGVQGRRAVQVCWGVDSNHTPGLKYMVDLDGNIATTNDQTTIPVDNRLPATQQPAAPGQLAVKGGQSSGWFPLGSFDLTPASKIIVSAADGGAVAIDAVRVSDEGLLFDALSPAVSYTGIWENVPYGRESSALVFAQSKAPGVVATFQPNLSGEHSLEFSWGLGPDQTTQAIFTFDADGNPTTTDDQKVWQVNEQKRSDQKSSDPFGWSGWFDGGVVSFKPESTVTVRGGQPGVLSVASLRIGPAKRPPLAKWQDPKLPVEKRVDDLVSQLTMEEKASQVFWNSAPIPRLGIPGYHWWNEALHGIMRDEPATLFPTPIALAATFDPALIRKMAVAIGDETRATAVREGDIPEHRGLTVWAPTVNMARDPRWGRTAETYGEDPLLSSRMTVAFVTGVQGDIPGRYKAGALLKHFPANNEEISRPYARHAVSERALRDYFFAPFEAGIREANAALILTGYDGNNDVPAACDPWLLKKVLRDEWGFTRATVTDVGTPSNLMNKNLHHWSTGLPEACADQLVAGTDIIADFSKGNPEVTAAVIEAVKKGLCSEADLDRAVKGMFDIRFRLGLMDPAESDPYRNIPRSVIGSPEHIELARQTSRESMVLLKNQPVEKGASLLPINLEKVKKIAVLGPYADRTDVGPYNATPIGGMVTPLMGIRERVGDKAQVLTAPASLQVVSSCAPVGPAFLVSEDAQGKRVPGLKAEYFSRPEPGIKPDLVRQDEQINFVWGEKPVQTEAFSARWTGKLIPEKTGPCMLRLTYDDGARLYLDGKQLINAWGAHAETSSDVNVVLQAGQEYDLRIEYQNLSGGGAIRFEWSSATCDNPQLAAELDAARNSDLVIATIGLWGGVEEHEGMDRTSIEIPAAQTEWLKRLRAVNPNIVCVVQVGSSLAMTWVSENIPAILNYWYPGQQGGHALADVLFGDYNPAGRLPITFYASDDQLFPMYYYELYVDITRGGRTYLYQKDKPLYPFGHGLSYSTFEYSNLKLSADKLTDKDTLTVSVDVKNTGPVAGDEVVQMYVHNTGSRYYQPIKQMEGFSRIALKPGETKTVNLPLKIKDLHYWDVIKKGYTVDNGDYEIMVGASSEDIRQQAKFTKN